MTSSLPRLAADRLPQLPAAVKPVRIRTAAPPGIVHIGLGAFHRAHQAVFTEDAMAESGEDAWGILGISPRSRDVLDALRAQDGYYTLVEREGTRSKPRVVGSLVDTAHLPTEPDKALDAIAAATTKVVTLTVTEKGYRLDPQRRRLLVDEETRADAAGGSPRTVVGLLARGLQRRLAANTGPIAVACCDNLPANGELLRALVRDFCELLPATEARPVLEFVDREVGFPSSVVDRIVPATTTADRAEVCSALGLTDAAPVMAEPFTQWVATDDFPAGRPAWERSGVTFTADTTPYEQAKLRVLNGTNSGLAYLGGLAGYETIAEAVRDELLGEFARRLVTEDVLPTLTPPGGVDLADYAATVLRRFANPALGHRTAQVGSDGSQKIPVRLSGVIRERIDAGQRPTWSALVVAGWLWYTIVGESDRGRSLPVQDPLAGKLKELAGADPRTSLVGRPRKFVEALDPELAEDPIFVELVQERLHSLASAGALGAVRELVS